MKPRRCLWLVLVAVLELTAANPVGAQFRSEPEEDVRPHTPRLEDVRPPVSNPLDSLKNRLRPGHELNDADKFVDRILKNLTEKDRENIANQIKAHPEWRDRLAHELQNNPSLRKELAKSIDEKKITEKELTALRNKATSMANPVPTPPVASPAPHAQPEPMPGTPMPNPMVPTPAPLPESSKPTVSANAEPKADEPSGLKKLFSKALPKAIGMLSDLGLADDAHLLSDLWHGKAPTDNKGYLAKLGRRASKVARELPVEKMLAGDFSNIFGDRHLPDMPALNFSLGWDGVSSPSAETESIGITGEGAAKTVFWILVLIVVGIFFWKGKELLLFSSGTQTVGAWKLGPWPVRPERVRTRADLIKAFEYLAFLVLGLAARPRNHLELAADLAATADEPARRTAAARLARLYERARYAPAEDALPDDELRAVRRDLSFLAGVGWA